jgi:hypothetical protein
MKQTILTPNYQRPTTSPYSLTPMLVVFDVSPLERTSLSYKRFVSNRGEGGYPLKSKVYQNINKK